MLLQLLLLFVNVFFKANLYLQVIVKKFSHFKTF